MPVARRAARGPRRSARHRRRRLQTSHGAAAARRTQRDLSGDTSRRMHVEREGFSRAWRAMTQAAVVHYALEPLAVELRDVAIPDIGESDVLLRVGAVSVCGSDVHQAYNTHSWTVNVQVVLGHEFAGTVAQAGRSVKAFREGDRVVSETAAEVCGDCLLCRTGRYNLCPHRKGFGYGINGAMASYVKVPARCLHRIPDALPFELACLAEPNAVAYNAMLVNSQIRPGKAVVVRGLRLIGLVGTGYD